MFFDGTFHYWNEKSADFLITTIHGKIDFDLVFQTDDYYNENVDWVRWAFELETFDGRLHAQGILDNEEATGWLPQNQTYLGWEGAWDVTGSIEESYTGINWNGFFNAVVSELNQDPWNLVTNENFLPTSIQFSSPGDIVSGHNMMVDLTMRPVPEPSVNILISIGALFLLYVSRPKKRQNMDCYSFPS
jgi:hypothetical protein